jgi:hypoxanthine phosphoribosyltransferase
VSGPAEPFLDAGQLRALVLRLASEIERDHPEGVVLVGVLNGCLCFLADLARALRIDARVDFLALSAFAGRSAKVRVLKDLELDVNGTEVVLVEDIVDTGLSARYVMGLIEARGAASVEVCTLLDRPSRRIVPVPLRYIGVEAPDDFLVGYGLDAAGRYRNLAALHRVEPAALDADPGAYDALFSRRERGPGGVAESGRSPAAYRDRPATG